MNRKSIKIVWKILLLLVVLLSIYYFLSFKNIGITGNVILSENGEYSLEEIKQLPNYLWFMATVGDKMYSGVYGGLQKFYYSDPPFTNWFSTQISSGDESTRVYNLNNKFYATSEGGDEGNGGLVYTNSGKCYDFPSETAYVLGAEYHDEKYLISRSKGNSTDIYSCPCSGGQTCTKWKTISGIFAFHMTSFNGDLYLMGTGINYRTEDEGKVKVVRANGNVETLISSGPGSGVRAEVFDDKIFWGFSYDAEIWSYDGTNKKSEISFPGVEHFGDFEIFDGKLFVVVVNEGGSPEVWYRKNDSNGGSWTKVFSTSQLSGYGVSGNLVNAAGFFTKYEDSLYLNINAPNGGRGGPGYVLRIYSNSYGGGLDYDISPRDGFIDSGKTCTGTFSTWYQKDSYKNMFIRGDGWIYDYESEEWMQDIGGSFYHAQGNCNKGTYPRDIFINLTTGWAWGEFSCNQDGISQCDSSPADGILDSGETCSGTFTTWYYKSDYVNLNIASGAWKYVAGEWLYSYGNDWYWVSAECSKGTYDRTIFINKTIGWAYATTDCKQNGISYC